MVLFFVERLKVHCDLTKGNDEEECESVREESFIQPWPRCLPVKRKCGGSQKQRQRVPGFGIPCTLMYN